MAEVRDIVVPGSDHEIPVRVYRPAPERGQPLVVFFHGGGWVLGDIETHDHSCRELASRSRCIVASVDYRLAPEHPFPAAVDDAFASLVWLADHAAELGADSARLAVAGDSAGGNLAAVCTMLARDARGPALRFQLLVYPAVDARMATPSIEENAVGYLLTKADMEWFYGHYAGSAVRDDDWRLSPGLAEDLAGLPPALVLTAEYDPLRDEGETYAARLREAGVEVTSIRYPGLVHGFFGMFDQVRAADRAMSEAADAVRTVLA